MWNYCSSHYQHARTHVCFHFSLGLLPTGTNCYANSAWNHQSTLSVSLCTVHQLFNRHSQPWHSSGNGLMPIAGYLPKNRSSSLAVGLWLMLWLICRQTQDQVDDGMSFTVRLHVMQRMVLLSQFRLSIRLSDACIVTKLNDALRIFWYHTKRQSL